MLCRKDVKFLVHIIKLAFHLDFGMKLKIRGPLDKQLVGQILGKKYRKLVGHDSQLNPPFVYY